MRAGKHHLLHTVFLGLVLLTAACLEQPGTFYETHKNNGTNNPGIGDSQTPGTTTQDANDYVSNQWQTKTKIFSDSISDVSNFLIHDLKFIPTISGNGFLMWNINAQTIKQGMFYFDAGGSQWQNALPDMQNNLDQISLTYSTYSGEILASWSLQQIVFTSLFDPTSKTWSLAQQLGSGTNTRVMSNDAGQQFIFARTAMNGGFGFSIFSRSSSAQNWSTQAAQLHRMDATNPIILLQHDVVLSKDGNPLVVWLEQSGTNYQMLSSKFVNGVWQTPGLVVASDSTLNLASVDNIQLTTDAGGNTTVIFRLNDTTGMKQVYASSAASNSPWQQATQLNSAKTNTHIDSGPYISASSNGTAHVVWVEHDMSALSNKNGNISASAQDNTSSSRKLTPRDGNGGSYKLVSRQLNGVNWSAESIITTAANHYVMGSVNLTMARNGTPIISWAEKGTSDSRVFSSNFINGSWAQKQLVAQLDSATTQINVSYCNIDDSGRGMLFWAENAASTSGTNFEFFKSTSLNNIGTIVSNTGNIGGSSGNSSGNDIGGNINLPSPSTNWVTPGSPAFSLENSVNDEIIGPDLMRDNANNKVLYLAQKSKIIDLSGSNTIKTTIVPQSSGQWQTNIVENIDTIPALATLVQPIRFEQLTQVPNTGDLVTLIKDANNTYAGFYSNSLGWNKTKIGTNLDPNNDSVRLHVNDLGKAIVIYQQANSSSGVDLHAVEFSTTGNVTFTDKLTLSTSFYLLSHDKNLTNGSDVHVGWIEYINQGSQLVLHTATYIANTGWQPDSQSLTSDIATEQFNSYYVVTNSGKHIFLQNDTLSRKLYATIRNNNGSWGLPEVIVDNFLPLPDSAMNFKILKTIQGPQGNLILLWKQAMTIDTAAMNMYQSVLFNNYNNSWTTTSAISGNLHGNQSSLSAYMSTDTSATVAWVHIDGTTVSVYANNYLVGSGWSTPELIKAYYVGSDFVRHVDLAETSAGNASLVWDHFTITTNGEQHTIWISERTF